MENQKINENTLKLMLENCSIKSKVTETETEFNQEYLSTLSVFKVIMKEFLKPHWYNYGKYLQDTQTGIKRGSWDLSIQFKPNSRTRNMLFENEQDLYTYLLKLLLKRKPKVFMKFKQTNLYHYLSN
jgi:hypothetical protein